jgi:hypothetical protein
MWKNTAAIHSVLKKNYKAKFSISSILKKIKSTETILEKKFNKTKHKKKTGEKNHVRNTVAIHSVL